MEKIAFKMTEVLLKKEVIEESMYEIYQYGFLRMLEIGGAFLTGIVICLWTGMVKEGIIFFIFFVPLRSYLGGIHLKKYWQCYIASSLLFLTILLLTKYVTFNMYAACGLIVFGTAGIGIEAKREYDRQHNKVYFSIICMVLSILLLVSFLCFIESYTSILVLLCAIVILVFVCKLAEQFLVRLREEE